MSVLRPVFFPSLSCFSSWEIRHYSKVVYPGSFCKTSWAVTGRPVASSPQCLSNMRRIFHVIWCCMLVISRGGQKCNHVIKGTLTPAGSWPVFQVQLLEFIKPILRGAPYNYRSQPQGTPYSQQKKRLDYYSIR